MKFCPDEEELVLEIFKTLGARQCGPVHFALACLRAAAPTPAHPRHATKRPLTLLGQHHQGRAGALPAQGRQDRAFAHRFQRGV
eukprot:1800399-Prymnesium_polylepis.2